MPPSITPQSSIPTPIQHSDDDDQTSQKAKEQKFNGIDEIERDRSIDILRGLNCFAMILVNTAGTHRPNWLSHPTSIYEPIRFADTLFPCFVFTSGLASAQSSKSIHHHPDRTKLSGLKRATYRAIKLSLIGIGFHNLIPRLAGFHRDGLRDVHSYRIPSVLGRIGISSLVCHAEAFFEIKPPILPACLGLTWYFISRLRPFDPLGSTSQAWLDQKLFGSSHLHNPTIGFDPEGLLASLFTVPISSLIASYLARPHSLFSTIESSQLTALGILGMLLTGAMPSPSCKVLWTPTYVGQTTAINLLYWSLAQALGSPKNRITLWISDAMDMLGRRTLEIYVFSACCSYGLGKLGTWESLLKIIDRLLAIMGVSSSSNENNIRTRQILAGLARSSLLGALMIPLAKIMIYFNWKL